jgi:hypothetical protein
MNMKKRIDNRLSALHFDDTLQIRKAKRKIRPLAVAAAVFLCLLITVPVLGATIPKVNNIIGQVSPDMAQWLTPIQLTSEDQGLTVTVLDALTDGRIAVVYMTAEGERFAERFYLGDIHISSEEELELSTKMTVLGNSTSRKVKIRLTTASKEEYEGKKITVYIGDEQSDCRVTFKIRKIDAERSADCDFRLGDGNVDHITVSPLGVTLSSSGGITPPPQDLNVIMLDGSIKNGEIAPVCWVTSISHDNGDPHLRKYEFIYVPMTPLDIDQIKEVVIDGHSIPLTERTN